MNEEEFALPEHDPEQAEEILKEQDDAASESKDVEPGQ